MNTKFSIIVQALNFSSSIIEVGQFHAYRSLNFNNNGIRKITTLIRVTMSKHRLCSAEWLFHYDAITSQLYYNVFLVMYIGR